MDQRRKDQAAGNHHAGRDTVLDESGHRRTEARRAQENPEKAENGKIAVDVLEPGQLVRVNLAGLQAEGVMFQAAVTDAVGHIVKQTSEQPPKYLVKLLFSFRGVSEVEVPAERIHANK